MFHIGHSNCSDLFYFITSVAIAFLGSWLAQDYMSKINSSTIKLKFTNLLFLSLGLGMMMWSMNLVGLLSYQCPFIPTFDPIIILVSFLVGTVGSFFALYRVTTDEKNQFYLSGLIFATTIMSVHLIGIFSMQHLGEMTLSWVLVLLSFAFSLLTAFAAFYILRIPNGKIHSNKLKFFLKKMGKTVMIVGPLLGVQYTLLAATSYTSTEPYLEYMDVDYQRIVFYAGFAIILIFFSLITAIFVDRERMILKTNLVDEKFKSLFHSSPLMVLELDQKGMITEVNTTFIEKMGYRSEEVVNQDVLSLFSPKDTRELQNLLEDALSKGSTFIDLDIIDKNGYRIETSITCLPISQENEIIGIYLVAKDMTQRNEAFRKQQKAEEDLRDILKNQLGLINKFKKEGNRFVYTLADGQLLNKWGLTPTDILGKGLEELPLSQEMYHFHSEQYEKAWKGSVVTYESSFSHFSLLSSLKPVIKDGKTIEVISTVVDITQQKMVERQMLLAKEEADQANKAKSDFLSKMSHELRTPLNGVLGFTQILEMDHDLTEVQRSHTREILTAGRHLLNLINSVLDLARIESGKLNFEMEEVLLHSILQQSIRMVDSFATESQISISYTKPSMNPVVIADSTKLRQLFINLLDNSIKYNIPNGSVDIMMYQENDDICVRIEDTGIGISKDELQAVFEPFYRSKLLKNSIPGAGIGLSLVDQIIKGFDGAIYLNSEVGKGTTVMIKLPLSTSEETIIENQQDEKIKHHLNIPYSTVLYIEDNEMNQSVIQHLLGNESQINLLIASTGKEGLEIIQKEKIDLVLLDIGLPDMSGLEVTEKLRVKEKSNVPIIALSANAIKMDMENALSAGCNEYLTKPLDVTLLFKILEQYLRR